MRRLMMATVIASLAAVAQASDKAARYAWPSLTQDQTIALGEALKRDLPGKRVVIWCPGIDCVDLQADLDDAFQIAEWDSDFDRRRVDSNDDAGIFVGPRNADALVLVAKMREATGYPVTVVDAPDTGALAVFIGRRPR